MSSRMPSLDGLRAVSITFVIVGHVFGNPFRYDYPAVRYALLFIGSGDLGVSVFFGISGFLITSLLVGEYEQTGRVSLVDFYIRRGFRIFPAFYCYLLTILLLGVAGVIEVFPTTWLSSAVYIRNYFPPFEGSGDHFTAHAWSLAVEEQFYLFWPCSFALLGRRRAIWFAVGLVTLSPVARVLSYFLLPLLRTDVNYMTHTRMDALMVGCLGALLIENSQFKKTLSRAFALRLPVFAIPFLLFASPLLHRQFGGYYQLLIGYPLEAFAIVLTLLWLVEKPGTLLGRLLNMRLVAHVGVISYSLYLWQQLFTFKPEWWSIPATFLVAEISFWLVEQPFLRLRSCIVRKPPMVAPPTDIRLDVPCTGVDTAG